MFLAVMRKFATDLETRSSEINDLNVFPVPDSDTGTNSALTVAAGLAAVAELQDSSDTGLGELVSLVASGCSQAALGNSGIILSEYLRGVSTVLDDDADVTQWSYALKVGAQTAREALLNPEDGTMLTVADAAASVAPDSNFENYLLNVQKEVRVQLAQTQFMLPALKAAQVVDAGAVVVTLLHDAFAFELAKSHLPKLLITTGTSGEIISSYQGPRYELMFNFAGSDSAKELLMNSVDKFGDSISISGADAEFSFHMHTDEPEKVIEICRGLVTVGDTRVQVLRAE